MPLLFRVVAKYERKQLAVESKVKKKNYVAVDVSLF